MRRKQLTISVYPTLESQGIPRRIVNVASVPQRSPFRYPGGKTWLIPVVRRWLRSRSTAPVLIEPFAGGAIVTLTAILEGMATKAIMVELDEDVAAVWQTILSDDAMWLANAISKFRMTGENVRSILSTPSTSTRERALTTVIKNRVNRGGILAPGATLLKYGENGKGIRSRWYPDTLRKRILAIASARNKIEFIHGDGVAVMKEHAEDSDTVFFIDPPYTAAGKKSGNRLYRYHALDHNALFKTAAALKGDFLMTYNYANEILALAETQGFQAARVPMKNTHHNKLYELLIARRLDWLSAPIQAEL